MQEKTILDENEFRNFERQARASIDKLVITSLVNFMFITLFRNGTDQQKEDTIGLITTMRKDITAVHKEKAEIDFLMSDAQKKTYLQSIENAANLSLKMIDNQIDIFRKVQEEGL